ncbi:MAG: transposase [Pyrinomonadaceae bacterium]
MKKHRKRWSVEEKLEILSFYGRWGAAKAAREFEVSTASIFKWRKAFEERGQEGLENRRLDGTGSAELKKLRRENEQLKKLVAEKELRLRIQEELLKKSRQRERSGK